MVEHKDIQNPKDYSEKDYQRFDYLLFSDDTPQKELEEICMMLAHLPTKEAKDLLEKFKNSERAGEVDWLECAIDENEFNYLSPENDQEERDFLALKMVGEKDDLIVHLLGECDKHEYHIQKYEIELAALRELLPENPDLDSNISAIHDIIVWEKGHLEESGQQIEIEEKIKAKIRASIQTERLKNLDPMDIEHFHFDGEE
ncbi:MAG: hypothetical protein PHW79_09915 [Candidatus Marinimicrobia bacterium]|nr:hypothetical protein [Candidatus Neomarinimicrobiota bacterium]